MEGGKEGGTGKEMGGRGKKRRRRGKEGTPKEKNLEKNRNKFQSRKTSTGESNAICQGHNRSSYIHKTNSG